MQAKLRVARAALTFVGGVALGVAGPALGFELCMAEPMLVADNGAPPVPSAPAVATPAAPAAAPPPAIRSRTRSAISRCATATRSCSAA